MRVAVACDHLGFHLKAAIVEALEQDDHAVLDLGGHGADPVDYPPIAKTLAVAVAKNFVDRGILLCASGVGGAIAANRFSTIRAAASTDPATARESREQLDTNVLSVTAANLSAESALALVKEWMSAEFSASDQAASVLTKIAEIAGASPPRGRAARTSTAASHAAPAAAPTAPPVASAAPAAPAPAAPAPVEHVPAANELPKASDITAVMRVVAAVKDSDVKTIATRVLAFIRNRFPTAEGTVTSDGFAFTLKGQHVASVTIGKNFVEVEAGPDRVSTSKIRDLDRLDLLLNLPSITQSFDALKT